MATAQADQTTAHVEALDSAIVALILTHPDRPSFARMLRQFGERRLGELRAGHAGVEQIDSTKRMFNRLIVLADVSAGTIK